MFIPYLEFLVLFSFLTDHKATITPFYDSELYGHARDSQYCDNLV